MIRRFAVFVASLLVCYLTPEVFAQSADLSVSLTGPSTIFANYDSTIATVSFSITNAGPASGQDATIDFDPGLSTINLSGFTCTTATNHTRCTTSSMLATTVQGTGSIQVHQPVDGTVVKISATVSSAATTDPNPANNTSSVLETVVFTSSVILGVGWPTSAPQGATFGGEISVENFGPSYATGVKATFTLPQHVFFRTASWDSAFTTCATPPLGSSGDIVCTANKVGGDGAAIVEIGVTIDPATPIGTILNFPSSLTWSDEALPPQPVQTNVTVVGAADFTTSLASPASVEPGDNLTNTVTVTNVGPAAATNTLVTFIVSGGGSINSASGPAGWSCSVAAATRASCSISSFPPGTATFSFPTSIPSFLQPGRLTETVTARSASELTGLHDSATSKMWISPEKIPDFNVTIDAPPIVHPGGKVTYTITIKNTTPNSAYPVLELVTTPLSGVTWSNCPDDVGFGVCGLGVFAGGSSVTVLATVPVVADSASKMTGLALITGGNTPYLHDARATAVSTVQSTPADLAVALSANPTSLNVGDPVTFTVLVTNIGQDAATNVTIDAPLPASLAYLSSTGHCTAGADVQCSLGTLAPGAWSTTTITAQALEPGTVNVTASAATDSSDPQASNNSATVPINVNAVNPPVVRRRAVHH